MESCTIDFCIALAFLEKSLDTHDEQEAYLTNEYTLLPRFSKSRNTQHSPLTWTYVPCGYNRVAGCYLSKHPFRKQGEQQNQVTERRVYGGSQRFRTLSTQKRARLDKDGAKQTKCACSRVIRSSPWLDITRQNGRGALWLSPRYGNLTKQRSGVEPRSH